MPKLLPDGRENQRYVTPVKEEGMDLQDRVRWQCFS